MTSNLQVSLPRVGLGEQARAREHRIFPKSLPHGHHGLGKGGLLGVFLQLIEEGRLYAVLLDELAERDVHTPYGECGVDVLLMERE